MSSPKDEQWQDIWKRFYAYIDISVIEQGTTHDERKALLESSIRNLEGGDSLLSKRSWQVVDRMYDEAKDTFVDFDKEVLKKAEDVKKKLPTRRTPTEKVLIKTAKAVATFRTVKSHTRKGKTVKSHVRFVKGDWTKRQTEFIKSNYPTGNIKELSRVLNRTESSVRTKASRLGLRRTK